MSNQTWSKETVTYQLGTGLTLEKADWQTFSVWFATYIVYKDNAWFRQSFDYSCGVVKDLEICYWIKQDGKRIGGVLMEPNYMNCLFLIPPFSDLGKVVVMLRDLLIEWSDPTQDIIVGGVKRPPTPMGYDEISHYLRAGFRTGEARRCMIRPTEKLDIQWGEGFVLGEVSEAQSEEMAALFQIAFAGGAGNRPESFEGNLKEVKIYFKYSLKSELERRASTLVYDAETNKLVGACLIGMWEEWPIVFDVAVHPEYQGRGLAANMLKQALTVLSEQHTVLRLFVTLGNSAEMVYHKLGFMPGTESTQLFLPARSK